jgi:3-oxoacyl-[acyl-carrier-protein] synthase-3
VAFPELYLSAPTVRLPSQRLTNDDMIARVRAKYSGDDEGWRRLERTLRFLLHRCGTQVRYLEEAAPSPVSAHAVQASQLALEEQGVRAEDLDVLVYCGIARDYYEPATAAEVAGIVGAHRSLAYDVLGACAGPMLAVEDLAARFLLDETAQVGLVCNSSISAPGVTYAIPDAESVELLGAGLTVGNAATAMLLGRRPFRSGGRIRSTASFGMPAHHAVCQAPIFGDFRTMGLAAFGVAEHVPDMVRTCLGRAGWRVEDVDLFVFHQPADRVVLGVARALGVPADRVPAIHGLYANTEASSVPLTLRHLLDEGRVKPGMKLMLGSAAAGFTISGCTVEWMG